MRGQNRHSGRQRIRNARKKWTNATKRRRIRHFKALPAKIQNEVARLRKYILSRDPHAQVKLTGSWTKGTWVDEHTSEAFIKHRLEIRNKLGLSDIDLLVESSYDFSRNELQALADTKVDLWKLPFRKVKGIIIASHPYGKRKERRLQHHK